MNTSHPSQSFDSPALPRWWRMVVMAVVAMSLCACASRDRSRIVRHGIESAPPRSSGIALASHEAPVAVSRAFVDKAPTQPYDGPVAPCSCQACSPAATHRVPDSGAYMALDPQVIAPAASCPLGSDCEACVPCSTDYGPADEYLCDGGDDHLPAGVRHDWSVTGLEQEDTIAHYDTLSGDMLTVPSNRVCIYAPRFGSVRQVTGAMVDEQNDRLVLVEEQAGPVQAALPLTPGTSLQRLGPHASLGQLPPSLYLGREQAGELLTQLRAAEVFDSLAPYCDFQVIKLGVVDQGEAPWLAKQIEAANTWAGDQAVQVFIDNQAAQELVRDEQPSQMLHLTGPGAAELRLCKIVSTDAAHSGDEVEFTLRIDNLGEQKAGNVTVIDHLTTRLEYVPDSAKSSVDAGFATSINDSGSIVLRWELNQPLEPGQGAVLQFRCRVR